MTEFGYGSDPQAGPPVDDPWKLSGVPGPTDQQYSPLPLPQPRVRPRSATTAGVLLIVIGALGLLFGVLVLALANHDKNQGETVSATLFIAGYVQIVFSGVQIVNGVMVLQGKAWARVTAIVLCSLTLLIGVVSLTSGGGSTGVVGLGLNILLIRLLLNRDVIAWCRGF